MNESDFLALLAPIATHPAARGLADDAAVLGDLVLTHDMIVESVHFLPDDPPGDVAWKLLAVNLSDLAAKGAVPLGALMGYALTGDRDWDAAFVEGLCAALDHFDVPLLGGDTVSLPVSSPRVLGLTAIGRSPCAPARSGAKAGDALYVTGNIGGAGLGLSLLRHPGESRDPPSGAFSGSNMGPGFHRDDAVRAYRRPQPRLAEGRTLAPHVHAMMDVSDGLLLDASRMAGASGLALAIDLDAVPLFEGVVDRMAAVTAGDDYELLFAASATVPLPVPASRIGAFADGIGLSLYDSTGAVPLPARLGYLHGSDSQ